MRLVCSHARHPDSDAYRHCLYLPHLSRFCYNYKGAMAERTGPGTGDRWYDNPDGTPGGIMGSGGNS